MMETVNWVLKKNIFLLPLILCSVFLFFCNVSYSGQFKEVPYDDGKGLKGIILQFDDDEGRREANIVICIDDVNKEILALIKAIENAQKKGGYIVAVDFSNSDLTHECLLRILAVLQQYKIPYLDMSNTYDGIEEVITVSEVNLEAFKLNIITQIPKYEFTEEIIAEEKNLEKPTSKKICLYKKELFSESEEEE